MVVSSRSTVRSRRRFSSRWALSFALAGLSRLTLHVQVALTESWLILITRIDFSAEAGKPTLPSWQLLGAVLGVDILATVFAALGWMSGPSDRHGGWTDILSLCRIWAFSAAITIIIAFVYWLLNKIPCAPSRRHANDSALSHIGD